MIRAGPAGTARAARDNVLHALAFKEKRMRARHWMQIAAVASAIGLGGTAIAHDLDRTSSSVGNDNAAAQLDTPRSTMIDENAAAQLDTTQSTTDENAAAQLDTTPSTDDNTAPARTGSDVQSGGMGPANSRGQ
jgi:hypothetical protein